MNRPATGLAFPPPSKTLRWVMISLAVPWVVGVVLNLAGAFRGDAVQAWIVGPFAYEFDRVIGAEVWRLVTYAWVQPPEGMFRLLIHLVLLWLFGASLERDRGPKKLLAVFVAGIVGGAVVLLGADAMMRAVFGVGAGRTMGADAGVSALFGAVCWGWRSTELNLVVLRVRGLSLLLFFVALDVLRVVALGQVEAFASLGGVAMGIVVIDDLWRPRVLRTRWRLWQTSRALRRKGKESPIRWVH